MKKVTYKELASYLGVSESAVKQYSSIKRNLMLLGLEKKNEILKNRYDENFKEKKQI